MTKSLKIYDGIMMLYKGETQKIDSFPDLWKMFGWDIKNDPKAKECSLEIVRTLYCWGDITLNDTKGCPMHLQIIRPEID